MAKTKELTFTLSKDTQSLFMRPFGSKDEFDAVSVFTLRHLLSKEKARLLFVIKNQKPLSLYDLAKKTKRSFSSVLADIRLLERFGFIELIAEKKGKRTLLKPIIALDTVKITFQL